MFKLPDSRISRSALMISLASVQFSFLTRRADAQALAAPETPVVGPNVVPDYAGNARKAQAAAVKALNEDISKQDPLLGRIARASLASHSTTETVEWAQRAGTLTGLYLASDGKVESAVAREALTGESQFGIKVAGRMLYETTEAILTLATSANPKGTAGKVVPFLSAGGNVKNLLDLRTEVKEFKDQTWFYNSTRAEHQFVAENFEHWVNALRVIAEKRTDLADDIRNFLESKNFIRIGDFKKRPEELVKEYDLLNYKAPSKDSASEPKNRVDFLAEEYARKGELQAQSFAEKLKIADADVEAKKQVAKKASTQAEKNDANAAQKTAEASRYDLLKSRQAEIRASAVEGHSIGTIVSFGAFLAKNDRNLADGLNKAGAFIQMSVTISEAQELAKLGKLDPSVGISTLAATATTVGAIQLGLTLIMGGGLDSNAAGFKALGAQIESLRKEMHDRFDRVDESLENIYTELKNGILSLREDNRAFLKRLNEISKQLDVLQDSTDRIEGKLADSNSADKVTEVSKMFEYMIRESRQPNSRFSADEYRRYLGNIAKYGYGEPPRESTLTGVTRAKNDNFASASKQLLTPDVGIPRIQADYPSGLSREVVTNTANAPELNLNYILSVLKGEFGLEKDGIGGRKPWDGQSKPLPSYSWWYTASEMYLQGAQAWPEYRPTLKDQPVSFLERSPSLVPIAADVDSLIGAGKELQSTMTELQNPKLLSALLQEYEVRLSKLSKLMQAIETQYIARQFGGALGIDGHSFSPWNSGPPQYPAAMFGKDGSKDFGIEQQCLMPTTAAFRAHDGKVVAKPRGTVRTLANLSVPDEFNRYIPSYLYEALFNGLGTFRWEVTPSTYDGRGLSWGLRLRIQGIFTEYDSVKAQRNENQVEHIILDRSASVGDEFIVFDPGAGPPRLIINGGGVYWRGGQFYWSFLQEPLANQWAKNRNISRRFIKSALADSDSPVRTNEEKAGLLALESFVAKKRPNYRQDLLNVYLTALDGDVNKTLADPLAGQSLKKVRPTIDFQNLLGDLRSEADSITGLSETIKQIIKLGFPASATNEVLSPLLYGSNSLPTRQNFVTWLTDLKRRSPLVDAVKVKPVDETKKGNEAKKEILEVLTIQSMPAPSEYIAYQLALNLGFTQYRSLRIFGTPTQKSGVPTPSFEVFEGLVKTYSDSEAAAKRADQIKAQRDDEPWIRSDFKIPEVFSTATTAKFREQKPFKEGDYYGMWEELARVIAMKKPGEVHEATDRRLEQLELFKRLVQQ